MPKQGRRGARKARPSFNSAGKRLARDIAITGKALARTHRTIRRAEAGQRRSDTREWVMQRRERTRHLIELGGLVQKVGLVDLTDDDRATLYGAMLELAAKARKDRNVLALWKRHGRRAFDAEAEAKTVHGPAFGAPDQAHFSSDQP